MFLPTTKPLSVPVTKTRVVRCCDCGTERTIDEFMPAPPGWHVLHISNRIRCDTCGDVLSRVNVRPAPTYRPREDDTSIFTSTSIPMPDYTPRTPDPEPDFKSGGGGDFAGGGADGGWSDDKT